MTASLTATALELALGQLGVRERGGANRGPQVDEYLRSVGLEPGQPWCAAFVYWCFAAAARSRGFVNPVPKTGSTLRLWMLSEPVCRDSNPRPGLVYVLDHGGGQGHAGIVTGVTGDGGMTEVSGNTFDDHGGREGNAVAMHMGTPEVTHGGTLLGYLDFDKAAQPPPGVAA